MWPWPRLYCGRARKYFHTAVSTGGPVIPQNARIFFRDDRRDIFVGEVNNFRIGGAADETGHGYGAFARAAGEERRIPDRAERAKFFTARDQEAEAFERVADLLAVVGRSDDGDRRVGDAGKRVRQRGDKVSSRCAAV